MIDYLNNLFGEYYPFISTVFGILAAGFTLTRIYSKYSKWMNDREQRLINIETRLHHLDNSKDGRVNKLSILVESQINKVGECQKETGYVKGFFDGSFKS